MNMPDGVMCQSCAMPMMKPEDFGTNADGGKNEEYCRFCFQNGKFTSDLAMAEMIEKLIGFAPMMNIGPEEAGKMANVIIPTLKRWK